MFESLRRATTIALITAAAVACTAPVNAKQHKRSRAAQRTKHRRVVLMNTPAPVTLLKTSAPDYLSGEANVTVRGNQNPIVRLGMAQNGVTIIEFPAADRFFAIHTGNSDLVTVEDSPTKIKDHHMVLRAGSGFTIPGAVAAASGPRSNNSSSSSTSQSASPATSIIAQMRSGMVITFLMYPVQQLQQQAHRCVISYDRNEVVAARQSAGLAVNHGEAETPQPLQPSEVAAVKPAPASAPSAAVSASTLPQSVNVKPALAPVIVEVERSSKAKRAQGASTAEQTVLAKNALADAIREPKRFKKWSAPLHGLAVSTISQDVSERARLVVVAVRNTKAEAIRVVPGHPEMFVETYGDTSKPLQIEQIKKIHVETTTTGSVIPAGAVVYYALLYEPLILGARQHLRVAIGQTNAADEPVAADLTTVAAR